MNLGFHIIAKAPVPGYCKTRLAKALDNHAAAYVQEAFLQDHIQLLSSTRVPFHLWFASPPEKTYPLDSFAIEERLVTRISSIPLGEVLSQALQFGKKDLKWEYNFFIGVDSLLPVYQNLNKVIGLSYHDHPILGPTEDGGVFILGVPNELDPKFKSIPWETENVFTSLHSLWGSKTKVLTTERDVDYLEDLLHLKENKEKLPDYFETKNLLHSLRLQS